MSSRRSSVSAEASARMERRPSVSLRMSSESSLTAFDPEVVAPAERAAETGCSEASSASLVSSIEVGPGIDFSSGDAAHGVLPLVAERTPSLELPVWACGVSRWTPSLGDLIIPFIFSLISYTTYSNCTKLCEEFLECRYYAQYRTLPCPSTPYKTPFKPNKVLGCNAAYQRTFPGATARSGRPLAPALSSGPPRPLGRLLLVVP